MEYEKEMRYQLACDWAIAWSLNNREAHLLKELLMRANKKGICFARYETLMENCRLTKVSLHRAMLRLKKLGAVERIGRAPIDQYYLHVMKMQQDLERSKSSIG